MSALKCSRPSGDGRNAKHITNQDQTLNSNNHYCPAVGHHLLYALLRVRQDSRQPDHLGSNPDFKHPFRSLTSNSLGPRGGRPIGDCTGHPPNPTPNMCQRWLTLTSVMWRSAMCSDGQLENNKCLKVGVGMSCVLPICSFSCGAAWNVLDPQRSPATWHAQGGQWTHLGWHCLSDATCPIRPHLLYALFVVSRITIICYMTMIRHV